MTHPPITPTLPVFPANPKLDFKGWNSLFSALVNRADPAADEQRIFRKAKIKVGSWFVLDARPCAGEMDAAIVAAAWNFEPINRLNTQHLKVLKEMPVALPRNDAAAQALRQGATLEREADRQAETRALYCLPASCPRVIWVRKPVRIELECFVKSSAQCAPFRGCEGGQFCVAYAT